MNLNSTMTEEIPTEDQPVTKICPPPSELCAIKKNIPCPEEGCSVVFFTSSHLDMHLLKHHKRNISNKRKYGTNCQFHCPDEKCSYNVNSTQFFKSLKYLKQHYLKVHAKKSFQCVKCHKGFATEATMKHHTKSCGVKFTCSCNNTYGSYEALLTHAKRKRHSFDEKYKFYGKALVAEVPDAENATSNGDCPAPITIIVPVHLLAAVALSELSGKGSGGTTEKGVQTDACAADSRRSRKASSPGKACERATKRRMSAQTQTGAVGKWKQPKISAQTQTSGDSILMKAMQSADITVSPENNFFQSKSTIHDANKQHRKSMETQTSHKPQDNNVYNLNDLQLETLDEFSPTADISLTDNASSYRIGIDVGIADLWAHQKNSSGTQTSPVVMKSLIDQEEILSNSVTQTDLNFAFFEADSCKVNVNSDSQTSNIQRYFEDSSNCSFVTAQASTQNFEQDLANASCQENTATLAALTDEPGYSAAQMENILERNPVDVFEVNRSCNTETQTEVEITNSFLAECTDGDTSFTLCSNIETQTTEDFPSFELPSSNMCTQTCDDVLFSALEFVNNETQTAWPQFATCDDSMLVSTETQTALSGCLSNYSLNTSNNWFNSKVSMSETSHMETQTDIDEFRQLIAELSKQDSEDKLL